MAEWHVDADRLSIASLIWLNVRNTVATASYTPDAVVKKVEAEHTTPGDRKNTKKIPENK